MIDVHWVSLICICFISWLFGVFQGGILIIEVLHRFGSKEMRELLKKEFTKIYDLVEKDDL